MDLAELLAGIASVKQQIKLTGISLDSRDIKAGHVFFALAGEQQHGLKFSQQVQVAGAVAIIYDPKGADNVMDTLTIPTIAVENLAHKCGEIAARFYAYPSRCLNVIGITGTNGKTSCSQFLAQVLPDTAVMGTLGWGVLGDLQQTNNTTVDALSTQSILAKCVGQSIHTVAMEVSSHGLAQGRVQGVDFKGAIFTNLSQDHLDYHHTMEAYFLAKLGLFTSPNLQYAVVNLDDIYAERVLAAIAADVQVLTFSLKIPASLQATNIKYSLKGMRCDLYWQQQVYILEVPLLAEFNLQNSLAVLAVLLAEGFTIQQGLQKLAILKPIAGRMTCLTAEKKPLVVVDYAHTPDALQQALVALKKHCAGKLSVVFGCGGNRDKDKRHQMGLIAVDYADEVIVTNDNPRFEEPQKIINDICSELESQNYQVIVDRAAAIKHSIEQSQYGDIVLIAGKGHENYQDIKGFKQPFSDIESVKELLAA